MEFHRNRIEKVTFKITVHRCKFESLNNLEIFLSCRHNIRVLGFSSDGDQRLLSAMHYQMVHMPECNFVQDTIHEGTINIEILPIYFKSEILRSVLMFF